MGSFKVSHLEDPQTVSGLARTIVIISTSFWVQILALPLPTSLEVDYYSLSRLLTSMCCGFII